MLSQTCITTLCFAICFAAIYVEGQTAHGAHSRKHTGTKRTFAADGGAAVFLKQMQRTQSSKLSRILRRSRVEGLALATLSQMLDQDADLSIDLDNDVLFFECEGLVIKNASTVPLQAQDFQPDPLASQAFQLSSRPSAQRKIYLDFTGATVTDTAWNSRFPDIKQPPYDKDGDPASFSAAELDDIVAVWRAVSEDYAIFDVDVTTIRPRDFQGNLWVSIGDNASWYGSTAGGVANVGGFGDPYLMPAFVFPKNLGPDYAKYIWEAVSHEIGHTLGLLHDGVTGGTTYYTGQGDWAPIMGSAYYRPVTTWDKGEYAGANQLQDDIATISAFLPLLNQTAGDNIATATPLNVIVSGAVATGTAAGIVAQPGVANVYSFQAAAPGSATFEVDVMLPWSDGWARSNLDVMLVIYDSDTSTIATFNPSGVESANGLGIAAANASVQIPAPGTYYAAVCGASSGDPAATGYSNYGMRGSFQLTVTFPSGPSPSPGSDTRGTSPVPESNHPPSPNPRPAPKPQPGTLTVNEIRVSRSCNTRSCGCTARVYITDAMTGAKLMTNSTVRVSGTWTADPVPNWRVYPQVVSGTINQSGFIDLRAQRQGLAGSCTITVTSVRAVGYVWSAGSVRNATLDLSSGPRSVRVMSAKP